MIPGYNTNGFAHHRFEDTVAILGEIGYGSVALTLEREHLDPPDRSGVSGAITRIEPVLTRANMRVTLETGSRFLLDSRRKHQPTLISASLTDRQQRIEFLKAVIDIAAAVKADSVSLWSGSADDRAGEAQLWVRLMESLQSVLAYAEANNVRLSFEPEPGMFIDAMNKFSQLMEHVDHPLLGLTLDVGHIYCLSDGVLNSYLERWRDRLWNVHIEDMRCGVHEHLMFGDGGMDFDSVFADLRQSQYDGPLHVELSRHSHNAVETAKQAYQFMTTHLGES